MYPKRVREGFVEEVTSRPCRSGEVCFRQGNNRAWKDDWSSVEGDSTRYSQTGNGTLDVNYP